MKKLYKFSRRFIGIILATVMLVAGFAGPDVKAAATQELIVSCNIGCEFDSSFSLVYYYKIESTGDFSDIYLKVAFQKYPEGSSQYTREVTEITDYTYDSITKQYRFVFSGISAPEMSNIAYATLCAKKGNQAYASSQTEYSVKQYAEDVLKYKASSNAEADQKLCTLMVDMLNYGASAQKYFGRNTGKYANKDLTSAQKALGSTLISTASSCLDKGSHSSPTATLQKIALSFDNTIDLVVYATFKSAPSSSVFAEVSYTDIEGKTKKQQIYSKDYEYDSETGLYRMEFEGISPLYIRTPLKIVFCEGSKVISATTTYSYESYVKAILDGSYNSDIKDLVKKMLTYGVAAKAFYDVYGSSEQPIIDDEISKYKNSKYTKDMPKAVIVVPSSATDEETYAATNILQKYIAAEEGYTPEIIKDSVSQGSKGFEISVGNTNRPHGTAAYSSDGSYHIYSYSNGISILGVGKRGTIDGAAKFLALCGGYFWLSFEDGYKTNQTKFKYETNINYNYERPFIFTDIDAAWGVRVREESYRMFDIANGLNGYFTQMSKGFKRWYLYSDTNTDPYIPGQVHTLVTEYFHKSDAVAHPDWFVKVNGKIDWTADGGSCNTQLCLTNSEVRQHILAHVKEILKSNKYDPNAPMQILSISQADNSVCCQCSKCEAFMKQHRTAEVNSTYPFPFNGGDSALYIDLCNWVSEEIHKNGAYQNVYIDTLAYEHTLKPPKDLEINDHVIVRYAAINRCYAHNCDDTTCMRNLEDSTYLQQWASLCNKNGAQLWIWDYNANWYSTIMPYANIDSQIHDIKYYKSLGVKGIYLQSNDRPTDCNTEFGDLRLYLGATLLENPNADAEKEMDFFLHEYYGKGAPYIKEYLEAMTKQEKNHLCGPNCPYPRSYQWRLFCLRYDSKPGELFRNEYIDYDGTNYATKMDAHNRMPDDEIEKCEQLYNDAMAAVASDTVRHKYTTGRTLVSWKIVKSILKVKEFGNSSTYTTQNGLLYDELVDTYHTEIFSLIWRTKTKNKLDKNPAEWVVK